MRDGALWARCTERMQRELEDLRKHYANGNGDFEQLQDDEWVELEYTHSGKYTLCIQVSESLPAHEQEQREKELRREFSLMTFVRMNRHSEVYTVCSVQEDKRKWYEVSNLPHWLEDENITVRFFRSFAREQRALASCRKMQDPRACRLAIQVLFGAAENSAVVQEPSEKKKWSGVEDVGAKMSELVVSNHTDMCLNAAQRQALLPENARVVQLVHGPPGTGKTSVINGMLSAACCDGARLSGSKERHVVAVLSEKNLAVDAVAAMLRRRGGDTPGHCIWEETIAHGNCKSFGVETQRFILSEKAMEDLAVVAALEKMHDAAAAEKHDQAQLQDILRENIPVIVQACGPGTLVPLDAKPRPEFISLGELWEKHEKEPTKLIAIAADLLQDSEDTAVKQAKKLIAAAGESAQNSESIHKHAKQEYIKTKDAVRERLRMSARIVLSTLGSSHGLLDDLLLVAGEGVSVTVICDEASTVHTALFVGAMDSIEAHITNIIVIGDDHQLPPYCPLSHRKKQFGSLFYDANAVATKVFLSQQYRAPRCIMELLNRHFYTDNGLVYAKQGESQGALQWIDVPGCKFASQEPYVSDEEAFQAMQCALKHAQMKQSVLVVTPYRNQLVVLKCMKEEQSRGSSPDLVVCTVDGAQGQEADVVVLSLVKQQPTMFLTAYRLCVMLSRARCTLVVVGDHSAYKRCKIAALRDVAQNAEVVSGGLTAC